MRSGNRAALDRYNYQLSYGDNASFLASLVYRLSHDNPLSFWQWGGSGAYQKQFHSDPGHAFQTIVNAADRVFGDKGRIGVLLNCDLIMDVNVTDTMQYHYPSKYAEQLQDTLDMALVTCSIIDAIKGKYIPACPGLSTYPAKGGSRIALSGGLTPTPTYATPAMPGACLQFQYSPEWYRDAEGDVRGFNGLLNDSTGWWVKPGKEYIVFLTFIGEGRDSANTVDYFEVRSAGNFGTNGCMYPVQNGIVQDPFDDFGFGATNLSPDEWKNRLRARINSIVQQ